MNLLYISPQFPRNFINFAIRLRALGANVLGVASDNYHALPEELRGALTEYYQVDSMHDYAQLLEAGRYFCNRYGMIDRIESHNEYWLPFEAALREDLGVWGKNRKQTALMQHKSSMKERFRQAGIKVAEGIAIDSLDQAQAFVAAYGYPVVLKPNKGVGAEATWRVNNEEELARIFDERPTAGYFIEQFVEGAIVTFDGLTNSKGEIVYCNSLQYSSGIMETVNDNATIYYWTQRKIAEDLEAVGRRTAELFDVREKFFHFEYFRTKDNSLLGLEVNVRPPGGYTVDMWNYADDIDLYAGWARVVTGKPFDVSWSRRYHSLYISRKDHITYRYSDAEIYQRFASQIVLRERISPLFRNALGDTGYVARAASLDELAPFIDTIQETA